MYLEYFIDFLIINSSCNAMIVVSTIMTVFQLCEQIKCKIMNKKNIEF